MPLYFLNSLQLLIVITPQWDAVSGVLYRMEKEDAASSWRQVGSPIAISVGKNGMAWGRGLHEEVEGVSKREGDGKAPAGIFSLGVAFGDERHQNFVQKMPYLLIENETEAIDDPSSKYYNTIVNRFSIEPDWTSSEKMKEIGDYYALGLVVEHNANPIIPFCGSCIFLHIWSGPGQGTAGCTAMEEKELIEIARWLDKSKNPRLVQLPFAEYEQRKQLWDLP